MIWALIKAEVWAVCWFGTLRCMWPFPNILKSFTVSKICHCSEVSHLSCQSDQEWMYQPIQNNVRPCNTQRNCREPKSHYSNSRGISKHEMKFCDRTLSKLCINILASQWSEAILTLLLQNMCTYFFTPCFLILAYFLLNDDSIIIIWCVVFIAGFI